MAWSLRDAAREPLARFLVGGALLAGLDYASQRPDETARVVVVDDGVRSELSDAYLHEHGRAPSEAELAPAIDRWIDEEVLYREGLARGLDRDDVRVRQRVATLMQALVEAEHPVPEPTEEEVRAHFDAHPERWAEDARIDFTHVFVAGHDAAAEARANELLTQLSAGASPIGMGDTFSGGRHYRGRRLADLAESFGDEFAAGLDAAPADGWVRRPSRFGIHLVHVERFTAASAADYEAARPDVEHALREERRSERAREAVARLRERWEIRER